MESGSWTLTPREDDRGEFTRRLAGGSRFRDGSALIDQRIKARAAELQGEPARRSPWAPTKHRF